jgi:hypothetical protein
MCYCGCPHERSDGTCGSRFPRCQEDPDEEEFVKDYLYDQYENGNLSCNQANSKLRKYRNGGGL